MKKNSAYLTVFKKKKESRQLTFDLGIVCIISEATASIYVLAEYFGLV